MTQPALAAVEGQEPVGSDPQRILVVGGMLMIASGMLFGDVFAMFVLHPNNARIAEAMYAASQLIPAGDTEGILSHFMAIGGLLENRGTKVDAHSHMIHMGYIALLLAMLQPWVAFDAKAKKQLAWFFVLSGFLLPPSIFSIHYLGLAGSPLEFIGWGSILADLFGTFLSLAVFLYCYGLWRHVRGVGGDAEPAYIGHGNNASRTLLVGGLLLIVAGFLYGAAMAAWNSGGTGPCEVAILKDIVAHSVSADQIALDTAFGAYGEFQMYKAINVATHAHINEMGILLLLLSFVQSFVQYADGLRNRWAHFAVLCGFGLPLGIMLEIPYGFVGSVIADLSGFGMIVVVLATLFGLLRHTGASDANQGGVA